MRVAPEYGKQNTHHKHTHTTGAVTIPYWHTFKTLGPFLKKSFHIHKCDRGNCKPLAANVTPLWEFLLENAHLTHKF